MKNNMEIFKNQKKIIVGRYSAFVGMLILSIIHPISDNYHSFSSLYHSIIDTYQSYFNGLVSSLMFIFFLLANYIFGAAISAKYVRSLEIKDKSLVIRMFGIIKSQILQIYYSNISKLEYSKDQFKNFEITLKNGEKKVIYPTIKKKEEAFKLIQQKILESQNKD